MSYYEGRTTACLGTSTGEEVVTAGALINVPGGEQTEGALARLRLQEVVEVVQLIPQIAVRQHDPLHQHILV